MEKGNDKNAVLLTVIGIATLLVAIVGATFAYFTAQVNYTDEYGSTLTITAASGGTTVYTGGDELTIAGIYPRSTAWAEKVISITYTNANTINSWNYSLDLKYTNTLPDDYLTYRFEAIDGPACVGTNVSVSDCSGSEVSMDKETTDVLVTTTSNGVFKNTKVSEEVQTRTIELGNGTFVKPTTGTSSTHVYKLTVWFLQNANVNQNAAQDKAFSAHIVLNDLSA